MNGYIWKEILEKHSKTIDLFMFMGQSNMAGRGIAAAGHPEGVPELIQGAGYEYRAVTSPDRLHIISEPFGKNENRPDGIDDGDLKTGSLVTAFANAYYKNTGIPIVGISASKGGSKIGEWQPGGKYLTDTVSRLSDAVRYLDKNGYTIRHKFMLWCQGESDGDVGKSAEDYRRDFENMLDEMMKNGIEKCFLIRTGKYNGKGKQSYSVIRRAQEEIASANDNVAMVSIKLAEMKDRGLMKDEFHYYQQAYNEVGHEAGENTAVWANQNIAKYLFKQDAEKLFC